MEDFEKLSIQMVSLHSQAASLELQFSQFRTETRVEFSALREELRGMHGELVGQIAAGDEDTRVQMRILHEDVVERIALLGEQLSGRKGTPRPSSGRERPRSSKKAR